MDQVLGGGQLTDASVERKMGELDEALDVFEQHFLPSHSGFINGLPQVSLADLVATAELEQPLAAGYDFLAERPRLATYMLRVRQAAGAALYDDAHLYIHRVRQRVSQGKL